MTNSTTLNTFPETPAETTARKIGPAARLDLAAVAAIVGRHETRKRYADGAAIDGAITLTVPTR